ncbi:MAG: hypothetical protein IBJ11_10160 [Phycisphaerales bacterium]|nr:hypothetical protein [Phycisphaerales bacterium]
MIIDQVTNIDAGPALRAMIQFAGQRQRLIAHNIANISTPGFRPVDVDPKEFQRALGEAIDRRRERFGGMRGELEIRNAQIQYDPAQGLRLRPKVRGDNVMFHDRNDRDLERLMQANAENAAAYRLAVDLLRNRTDQVMAAIRERGA